MNLILSKKVILLFSVLFLFATEINSKNTDCLTLQADKVAYVELSADEAFDNCFKIEASEGAETIHFFVVGEKGLEHSIRVFAKEGEGNQLLGESASGSEMAHTLEMSAPDTGVTFFVSSESDFHQNKELTIVYAKVFEEIHVFIEMNNS